MTKGIFPLRGRWRMFYGLAGALWLCGGICPLAAFAQEADGGDAPEPPPAPTEEAMTLTRRPLTDADKALFDAIEIGDGKAARAALEQGAQADARNENDATPLMKAAFWGEAEIVALLLEAGANPNRLNRQGQSPLLIAAMDGYLVPDNGPKIREMVRQQSQRRLTEAEGNELRALYSQNLKALADNRDTINATKAEITRMLLEAGANPRIQGEEGATALHKAAATRNAPFIRWLLHYGASLYTLNAAGETPLMRLLRDAYSADPPTLETLRLLVTPNGPDGKAAAINRPGGWQGYTPLMEAVGHGNIEAARILLERGADPNRFNSAGTVATVRRNGNRRETVYETSRDRQGVTALWVACETSYYKTYPEITDLLLASGARADIKSSLGSPLIALLRRGPALLTEVPREKTIAVITKLLDAGADVNGRSGADLYSADPIAPGATPLLLAYRVGDGEIVNLLRKRGGVLTARDKFGANAVSYAIQTMPTAVIAGLLKEGLSPDTYDASGATPLLQISDKADALEKIRLLLDAGANVNAVSRDAERDTALHRTARNDGKDAAVIIQLLVERGANLYAESADWAIPFFYAIDNRNVEMVKTLLRLGTDPRRRNARGESALTQAQDRHRQAELGNGDQSLPADHPTTVILRLLEK